MKSVTADVGSIGTPDVVTLNPASCTLDGTAYNYASASQTARLLLVAGTTLPYSISAADALDQSVTTSYTVAVQGAPTGPVKAQYRNYDALFYDNQIKPGLAVVNTGASLLSLSGITMRYWFTKDAGASTFSTWCDYAAIGCGAHHAQRRPALAAANGRRRVPARRIHVRLLAPGASIGESQLRFNKTDWSTFNETNDYSWTPPTGTYADTTKVTVYQNGSLVWGTEPR
jgi:hypothetical protein